VLSAPYQLAAAVQRINSTSNGKNQAGEGLSVMLTLHSRVP